MKSICQVGLIDSLLWVEVQMLDGPCFFLQVHLNLQRTQPHLQGPETGGIHLLLLQNPGSQWGWGRSLLRNLHLLHNQKRTTNHQRFVGSATTRTCQTLEQGGSQPTFSLPANSKIGSKEHSRKDVWTIEIGEALKEGGLLDDGCYQVCMHVCYKWCSVMFSSPQVLKGLRASVE